MAPGLTQLEEPVVSRLIRIEAKINRLLGDEPKDIIGIKDVMRLTGCRSYSAAYRMTRLLGVRYFTKGKYRRAEVENAIARKSLNDRMADNQTEARSRSISRTNPHDD